MSKVAVVYWSGTGNTETMANAVAEGAKGAGAEVDVLVANDFNSGKVAEYDGIAFGCPAMGAENLEESEFEPMFTEVEGSLSGRKLHFSVHMDGEAANGWLTGRKKQGCRRCSCNGQRNLSGSTR